jgi:hypothetical protein
MSRIVAGIAHPRAAAPEHAETPHLSAREIQEVCSKLPNMPVMVEHKGEKVGTVQTSWMDGTTRQLMVHLDVDGNNATADAVRSMLDRRTICNLSLRWEKTYNKHTHETTVTPVEVSIVHEGLMPDTDIVASL